MLHLLDTDTASYIIKNRAPAIVSRLADIPPDALCVSAITRAELLYGLKRLAPDHRLHIGVNRFLTIIRVLPWTADAADHYADIRHRLVSAGQPIGELDMMIAAHALSLGAILVTSNIRHFGRVGEPLMIENWTAEP